jgi:hypothetical protein
MRRRIHRVLVVAVFLVAVAGLWPSPARALSCTVVHLKWCGLYICCVQACTYCYDQQGNLVGDPICGDPICWNRNN